MFALILSLAHPVNEKSSNATLTNVNLLGFILYVS
jgi:hypothetical protein